MGQNLDLPQRIWKKSSFLTALFDCDICLGFWVFLVLSPLFGITIIPSDILYIVIISYGLTAMLSAFVTHIFVIGWRVKFGVTVLE